MPSNTSTLTPTVFFIFSTLLGTCEPNEFQKAIEKIGVSVGSKKDVETLFKYYDRDHSGSLDYKEFSQIICGNQQKMDMPEKKSA